MRLLVVALAVVLLSACSSSTEEPRVGRTAASPATTLDACEEVRAGIDAFNLGDYDETVDHFRKAVPLAEDQAESDDSQDAKVLVEAIRYYAELPPADYPESARSSADFARYKAITLGQCVPIDQPGDDPTPDQMT